VSRIVIVFVSHDSAEPMDQTGMLTLGVTG
jgi:hypothetical protein